VKILVEKNNIAHTENFIQVKIDGNYNVGEVVKAKLHSFSSNYMIARRT